MLTFIGNMDLNHVEIIGHASYLLIMFSFMVKRIWYLRMISIIASISSIYYGFYINTEPLWVPVLWNFVFISINIFHLILIAREKRKIEFKGDEKMMYENIFSTFLPGEFKKILKLGQKTNLLSCFQNAVISRPSFMAH